MSATSDIDRVDFGKFCKYFTLRAAQAIVQSRTGYRVRTRSRVQPTNADWFTLNVDELPELTREIRAGLNGHFPGPESPVRVATVLTSLRTADDRTLTLEAWTIRFDSGERDSTVNVRSHAYHRFGTLLRSVLAASRAAPAYRCYARKQSKETFWLCYQVKPGEPDAVQLLGADAKSVTIGAVVSAFGTLNVRLGYRTRMVISSGGHSQSDPVAVEAPPPGRSAGDLGAELEPLGMPTVMRLVAALNVGEPRQELPSRPSIPMMFPLQDAAAASYSQGSSESLFAFQSFSTSPPQVGGFCAQSPLAAAPVQFFLGQGAGAGEAGSPMSSSPAASFGRGASSPAWRLPQQYHTVTGVPWGPPLATRAQRTMSELFTPPTGVHRAAVGSLGDVYGGVRPSSPRIGSYPERGVRGVCVAVPRKATSVDVAGGTAGDTVLLPFGELLQMRASVSAPMLSIAGASKRASLAVPEKIDENGGNGTSTPLGAEMATSGGDQSDTLDDDFVIVPPLPRGDASRPAFPPRGATATLEQFVRAVHEAPPTLASFDEPPTPPVTAVIGELSELGGEFDRFAHQLADMREDEEEEG